MNFGISKERFLKDLRLLMDEENGIGLKQAEITLLKTMLKAENGFDLKFLRHHLESPPTAQSLNSQISRLRRKLGQNAEREAELNRCFKARTKNEMPYWLHIANVVDGECVFYDGNTQDRSSQKQLCYFTGTIPGRQQGLIPLTEQSFLAASKNETEDDKPPSHYSLPYLQTWVAKHYGADTGFLVIRYGSSVVNNDESHDEDYLVLIHGNHYIEEKTKKEQIGETNVAISPLDRPLDIQRQLFDSFMIALIIGKPYELSVALDGVLEDAHQMPNHYWKWLRAMALNMTFDADYLKEQLSLDLDEYIASFKKNKEDGEIFNIVIAGYHYACTMIQIHALGSLPKLLRIDNIYPLSKTSILATHISDEKTRTLFVELVDMLKRKIAVPEREPLVFKIHRLVNRLRKEFNDGRL